MAQPLLALLLAVDAGAVCGDAALDAGEQCDDGGFERADGCSARCEGETELGTVAADCIVRANGAASKLARSQGKQSAACVKGAAEFSSATVGNSLKWAELSPSPGSWDFTDADAEVDWIEAQSLRVRGHTLFWDRLNGRPAWLVADVTGSSDPAEQLRLRMEEHAAETVGRYAGRIAQWDVVNEPLEQTGGNLDAANFFYQVLGEEYLDIAFHAALPHDTLVSRLERLTALGVKVEFTEVDVPLSLFDTRPDPLAAQAVAWADIVAACASVPGCTGVTAWGTDDADTWLDTFSLTMADAPSRRPLLFDAALVPKPAYDSVKRALEWSSAP